MRFGTDYSYFDDPEVPAFDDARPIVLMDANCALCSTGARMIDHFDRSGDIRICPMQTQLGRALLRHYGLSEDDPETWLLIEQGRALGGFEAMIRVGLRSGGWGRGLWLLRLLPRALRARAYAGIAHNRYRWFGRGDLCNQPAPGLRARLMLDPP